MIIENLKTDYVGSTAGMAVTIGLSPELTDEQFRLLALLSECPDGHGFSADFDFLVAKGMDLQHVQRAATLLDTRRDLAHGLWNTKFFLRTETASQNAWINWRFYK